MGNYNFSKDLKASQASVEKVANWLITNGCSDITYVHTKEYDLLYTKDNQQFSIEVKEDLQFEKTGNVAIELRSRNKPSGIASSLATYWVYVLGEEVWMTERSKLILYLIQHWDRFRRVEGGDDNTSLVALLKLKDFKDIFRKL
jgi:hypothetical protein